MKQVVLATRNPDKVNELLALFHGLGIEFLTLDSFPHTKDVDEDQDSLEGNALKKAREASHLTQLPALADDSGLEVHYLNGEPGVFSSRYAGPDASYASNRQKLLERMRGVPARRRGARFRCVLALVAPGRFEKTVEGTCLGSIIESPRGENGFGYDPIFVPSGYEMSLAEMDSSLKNTLSHRAKATMVMRQFLSEDSGSSLLRA
jgi:XTP/dITP diphosphohydrolase